MPGQLIPIPIALPPLEVFYDQFIEKEENFSLVYNALHNTLEVGRGDLGNLALIWNFKHYLSESSLRGIKMA